MPWAQRVTLSVSTICRPSVCAAGLRPLRCSFLPAYAQHAGSSPALTRLSRSGTPFLHHSFRQQRIVRQATSQLAEHIASPDYMTSFVPESASSDDISNSGEAPASAAYRVVNFYHLVDIPNPYQASQELGCAELQRFWHVECHLKAIKFLKRRHQYIQEAPCIVESQLCMLSISVLELALTGDSRAQAVDSRQGLGGPHLLVNSRHQRSVQRLDCTC